MFYNNLTELCARNDTTVTTLLKELKLSTSKGTAWKNGSVPNGEVLALIASHFNVTTDYLLGVKADKQQKNEVERDDKLRLIARRITEIPEKDREKVLAIFEATLETFLKKDNDDKNKR